MTSQFTKTCCSENCLPDIITSDLQYDAATLPPSRRWRIKKPALGAWRLALRPPRRPPGPTSLSSAPSKVKDLSPAPSILSSISFPRIQPKDELQYRFVLRMVIGRGGGIRGWGRCQNSHANACKQSKQRTKRGLHQACNPSSQR